ncbi:MAG: chorismate lyase [Magnetococcus sp. DMHC-1]|nr:chorismate lyase [Magnetococcales bacterium]
MISSLQILETWQDCATLAAKSAAFSALNVAFRNALTCTGSLTRHLESALGEPLRVRLEQQSLRQEWQDDPILWNGSHHLPTGEEILVRDAWLSIRQQDVIFAHSEMVLAGLAPELRTAVDQGAEPLGLLFQGQAGDVRRQRLELARALVPELARRTGLPVDQIFWCRRSLFMAGNVLRARILELFIKWE